MGKRISNLPDQPELKSNDFLVVDGTAGTRKVPIDQSIILSGQLYPTSEQGVQGGMYVQYSQSGIVGVYFKTPDGWKTAPSGGSYSKPSEFSVSVSTHHTVNVTSEEN